MTLLISPTEPPALRSIGNTSSVPETLGVDILFGVERTGLVGVQRKEIRDLVASMNDGRLAKEVGQMARLSHAILIVEGRPRWTLDGELMDRWAHLNRRQFRSLLWSVRSKGIWVETTESLEDTIECVQTLYRWVAKPHHDALARRPKPAAHWGTLESEDWGIHLLQSFPGIGPGVAKAIYDHFGGVPIGWSVTAKDLQQVPGVGPARAKSLIAALSPRPDTQEAAA